ncbi:malate synthase AceB [Natronolimnohabitans innermongolicus]|uniref:HpcH/HpaI aldolase n=1 Tax=Natronolimnohabitans innermongolicus JCM 12255 TaxID=1227499 RepID=L9WYC2_9EURY|nr:malate synthase AceB [Natronolimnohabitans innermongolicus]ELY54464.1 HpcH/HpaI aldolase [Natronolimnohabitans innermongolicus JCM 12255]
MSASQRHERAFVRTFFTSPTAVEGKDDSAAMLRRAAQLRGMEAPDVWVPDNEDATAPSMRDEGAENIIDVVSEHGADVPGEIHPRVVWHRDSPETRYQGFQHMLEIADPDRGALEHLDGFVIPEVGDIDDWKKADEFLTIVEREHGLEERRLGMSVIIESGQAELALADLRDEIGKPTNNLERLFLLVDGEVDYTKDMRAITPTGGLPPWPELRHNTSRAASANGLIAVDGPYDDIRDVDGYHDRMTANRMKGMLGIWSLTPGQVTEANESPLPPKTGQWMLDVGDRAVELTETDGRYVYEGDDLELTRIDDETYRLDVGGDQRELDAAELRETLVELTEYSPSLGDIVDSMERFEAAKDAGEGAIAMERSARLVVGDTTVTITSDRMWDEATYQAAKTPIDLFQDVYEHRPDQRGALRDRYGESVVERAMNVG